MSQFLVVFFIYFVRSTLSTMKRIWKKFRLPPEVAITGSFDIDGTPTMRQRSAESIELEKLSVRKTWAEWPRRQYLYVVVFMDEFLGISERVFAERYRASAAAKRRARGRPANSMLHTIIRYLERPDSRPPRSMPVHAERGASPAEAAATRFAPASASSTRDAPSCGRSVPRGHPTAGRSGRYGVFPRLFGGRQAEEAVRADAKPLALNQRACSARPARPSSSHARVPACPRARMPTWSHPAHSPARWRGRSTAATHCRPRAYRAAWACQPRRRHAGSRALGDSTVGTSTVRGHLPRRERLDIVSWQPGCDCRTAIRCTTSL